MQRISVLLVFLALPLFGKTVVTLDRDGEVCRFRAGDAENPFRRWLAFDDVTCVAAGTSIEFPSGLWNVFGRMEGRALSAAVVIDGAKAPENLALTLEPAATLSPMLPPGQKGLVYSPRRNRAVPIAAGAQSVTVPANEELWLLVIEKRSIVAMFPIPALAPGSARAVDARAGGLSSAVVGWIQLPDADRAALKDAHDVSSPQVRLISAGLALDSDSLPPPASLNGSFVLVRGVAAGEAELRLDGHWWLPHGRRVKIADRAVTIVDEPLQARGAAALLVSWSSADDLVELDASLGSCNDASPATHVVVSVSACPRAEQPGEIDPAACKMMRQETFVPQVPYGSFAVDGIAPGTYRGEMRFGKLPPGGAIVEVAPFQQRRLVVSVAYNTLYGSLTRGGEPLDQDATLKLQGGGVGFASRETGEYAAVIPQPLSDMLDEDLRIDIAACDERLCAFVLTDRPLVNRSRYDIDIPGNRLTVRVTDTFTQMTLPGATLRYVIMSGGVPRHPVVEGVLKSEDGGELVLENVPEREIHLRVSHPGYQEQRLRPFTMSKSEEKVVDVQLVPLRGSSGRIISSRPFDSGMVLWFSAVGAVTERAELAPDGTFVYANSHTPDETMAVVSLSHPLWIARMPALARRQSLDVRFPDGTPVRAFNVSLMGVGPTANTYVGLVVGGILVPQEALRSHQKLRDLPTGVRTRFPMHIRDIAETGPIDVLLGPTFNDIPTRGRSFDPLLLPQSADAPRQRLIPGITEVVFEVK